jgi:hypothetical protein
MFLQVSWTSWKNCCRKKFYRDRCCGDPGFQVPAAIRQNRHPGRAAEIPTADVNFLSQYRFHQGFRFCVHLSAFGMENLCICRNGANLFLLHNHEDRTGRPKRILLLALMSDTLHTYFLP